MSKAAMAKHQVVLLRHGERVEEAHVAGRSLQEVGFQFDLVHTSLLTRAKQTVNILLQEIHQPDIPVFQSWRLNERHYGSLTGLNKVQTAAKHGKEQVQIWRRSFDVPPPPIEPENPYYEQILNDKRYANGPTIMEFPMVESLKLTIERALPHWKNSVAPQILSGQKVLIVAHGTSLRGIVKHLEQLSDEAITVLNIPNGIPFVYQLDENLVPVAPKKFLADDETVRQAIEAVASVQGKKK